MPEQSSTEPAMQVELAGLLFRAIGPEDAAAEAIVTALIANGAQRTEGDADLLIVFQPVLPMAMPAETPTILTATEAAAERMAAGKGGRVIFVLSALGALPMRGHLGYSSAMAAAVAAMRGLAMQLAPKVLVNAVGAGLIEAEHGQLLAGDRRMLTHTALLRAGTLADLANAVLFLCDPLNSYTTGQLLTVDGGWSIGYGRNF